MSLICGVLSQTSGCGFYSEVLHASRKNKCIKKFDTELKNPLELLYRLRRVTRLSLLYNLLGEVDHVSCWTIVWSMFLSGLAEVVFPPFPGDAAFLIGGFITTKRGFPDSLASAGRMSRYIYCRQRAFPLGTRFWCNLAGETFFSPAFTAQATRARDWMVHTIWILDPDWFTFYSGCQIGFGLGRGDGQVESVDGFRKPRFGRRTLQFLADTRRERGRRSMARIRRPGRDARLDPCGIGGFSPHDSGHLS